MLTYPDLGLRESRPVRGEEKLYPVPSSIQGQSLDTEDGEDHVGEDGGEPENLNTWSEIITVK